MIRKHTFTLAAMILVASVNTAHSSTDIGAVYGDSKWIAYVASNGYIYIRQGKTDFSNKCDTGFKLKGDYVMGPDGSSYKNNSSVRTAIGRYLLNKRYKAKGCQ